MKSKMNWIALLLIICMILSLAACGTSDDNAADTSATTADATETDKTSAAVPEESSAEAEESEYLPVWLRMIDSGEYQYEGTSEAVTGETRVVLDGNGKEVEIPANVERLSLQIGAMAQVAAMLGGADKIVAAATQNISEDFKKVFPGYTESNPMDRDSGNVEEIIEADAHVAIVINDENTEQLKAAGIAVVGGFDVSTVEGMCKMFRVIGDVLGGDAVEKADMFITYYKNNMAYVNKVITEAYPDKADRLTVLPVSAGADGYRTTSRNDISVSYYEAAGGVFCGDDLVLAEGTTVSAENIIEWDPDVIFGETTILDDELLQTVKAVQNSRVYVIPQGIYRWSIRSGEGSLYPLYAASCMYPEVFSDLEMVEEVKYFFNTFYEYDLTVRQAEDILSGGSLMDSILS